MMNNSNPRQTAAVRELTRDEKAAIKKLVVSMCANYSKEYGCLPLDCDCAMLHKCWTGGGCRYFRDAVLPLNPMLAVTLTGGAVGTRPCALCGRGFPADGKRVYCSAACEKNALRKQKRDYMRKKRAESGKIAP